MSINSELSKFYRKQGLTGKHLRSALKHDRRAVRQNIASQVCCGAQDTTLWGAFVWYKTPQGGDYWLLRVRLTV